MESLQHAKRTTARVDVHPARATVFVDCADAARQDVLVYWLQRGGYQVHDGPVPSSPQDDGAAAAPGVLLTDRFGPGLDREITIFQHKAQRAGLRVIIIGSGDESERAQLSLARAAGADATLSARVDRDALFELLSHWA
jgi:hypothetical protein